MTVLPAIELLSALANDEIFSDISLEGLCAFIRLVHALKRDILQPLNVKESDPDTTPPALPRGIRRFLGDALGIPKREVANLWALTGDFVWHTPEMPLSRYDLEAFRKYGWAKGLTALSLYPPSDHCTNIDCTHRVPLKKIYTKEAVVFTLGDGVQPAWHIHLYCPKCKTSYHNNYSVNNGKRTYYSEPLQYIQVAEHHFVHASLARIWRGAKLFGWFSATNCARLYDYAMADEGDNKDIWTGRYSTKLTTEHVWDAFVILSLLEDSERMERYLVVPHTGEQADRFTGPMLERNERMILDGQPDAVTHQCDKCTRFFEFEDGSLHSCQAIVSDGLSIGRPCCAHFRCTLPLQSNRDRFCAEHYNEHFICAVTDCQRDVVVSTEQNETTGGTLTFKKTCDDPLHRDAERKSIERGSSCFVLAERWQAQHAKVSHPTEPISVTQPTSDGIEDLEEEDITYVVNAAGTSVTLDINSNPGTVGAPDEPVIPCPSKSARGNRVLRAQLARRRTHNEQTEIRPCGMAVSRATMFGAEATSNHLIMQKNTFSVPGARKPEHSFYDTNCDARQQAEKDPWFNGIGMCVDVWHFKNKHAVSHEYCQKYCNPAGFSELLDEDGKWFFNTSVAEQTNAWLGGYHSICREMLPVKYDFFLDEMIRLRNIEVLKHLRARGYNPRSY